MGRGVLGAQPAQHIQVAAGSRSSARPLIPGAAPLPQPAQQFQVARAGSMGQQCRALLVAGQPPPAVPGVPRCVLRQQL
jgi:hypothetical protein